VARLWNKAPAIWFPSRLGTVFGTVSRRWEELESGAFRSDFGHDIEPVARNLILSARLARARGDERLSGSKEGESDAIVKRDESSAGRDRSGNAHKDGADGKGRDKGARKQRASDLGRALRSIYDDTLRESVPDDFNDLLGKLS
jgi:hypothetical protein